jgi:hypothetical protein
MAFPSRNRCQAFQPAIRNSYPTFSFSLVAPKDYGGMLHCKPCWLSLPRLCDKPSSCRHANEASPSYLTMLGNGNGMSQGSDRMFPNAVMSGTPWVGTGPRHSVPIATLSLFFLSTFSTSAARALLTFQVSPNHSSRSSCCSAF